MAIEACNSDQRALFSDFERLGMHQFEVRSFCRGSDHQILCDPLIGVPCVDFTQWPDMYYHTSGDTVDRIDPTLVAKTSCIAGYILWSLAHPDACNLDALLSQASENLLAALRRQVAIWEDRKEDAQGLEKRIRFTAEAALLALSDLSRLAPLSWNAVLTQLVHDERAKVSVLCEQALRRALALRGLTRPETAQPAQEGAPLLMRNFVGDHDEKQVKRLFEESGSPDLLKQHDDDHWVAATVDLWTTGKYTFEEIAERTLWECGKSDREFVGQYLRLMNRAGLVKQVHRQG